MTLYRRHTIKLETFHIRCLQKILRISFRDRVPHAEIRSRAGVNSVDTYIIRQQLRWTSHTIRMPENRPPRITLYSELQKGSRTRRGQKKRYKDHLKGALKSFYNCFSKDSLCA